MSTKLDLHLADEARIRDLQAEVRRLRREALNSAKARRILTGLGAEHTRIPKWVRKPSGGDHMPGVPVVFATDWHLGEWTDPTQLLGVNGYNLDVAAARVQQFTSTAIDLFQVHLRHDQEYPGVVLLLGGDMISGDIHHELSVTNEAEVMQQVLWAAEAIEWMILQLHEAFGSVDVYGTYGNHGRTTRKPRMKGYAYSSFDWLIYQMVARALKGWDSVTTHFPAAREQIIPIAGHKMLFLHGDQFRGGDGMVGFIGPIKRGAAKKQAIYSSMHGVGSWDLMALGHFHFWHVDERTVVGGTLKGYDEYAMGNNIPYEPPTQMVFSVHPRLGINYAMPVRVGEHRKLWR